ncbi:sex-lethal homolog isoform X1 [Homalodisca vitripennis]|uniref:sex-lethal homolog isoform X1 n=1 Tax=Homalodisca vitripennis TaxID=197043 RepID=UPI001EEACCAF|nr:sex-lethal homolog isoform X1 [Homalodisca vitripennis]
MIKMSVSPTNLIINYLPQNLADDGLKNIFSQIGVVESCKIMRDFKTGYSYGFAFVSYVTPEDAQKAIQQLNGYQIGSKHIKVSYARPSGENIKDTNLYVTNLPRDITEYNLKKMFEDFGEIVQMNLLKDKETGSSRGVAFVRYNQRCEAQMAISQLDGQTLPGSSAPLSVRVAQDHGKQKAHYYAGWQAGLRQNHQQVSLFGPHPSFMSRFNSLRWHTRPYPNTKIEREKLVVNKVKRFQPYWPYSQQTGSPSHQTDSMRANSVFSQQPAVFPTTSLQTANMGAKFGSMQCAGVRRFMPTCKCITPFELSACLS